MKKVVRKVAFICILAIMVSSFTVASFAEGTSGDGIGVSTQTPAPITKPGGIQPMGSTPPNSSDPLVTLGTYDGSITWASGYMYSAKWVKTSGTTIKIDADFDMYMSQADATNKTNPLSNAHANISIWLVDSSGNSVGPKYVTTCNGLQTVTFTVTANKQYYVKFNFNTGYYESGDFTVYKP